MVITRTVIEEDGSIDMTNPTPWQRSDATHESVVSMTRNNAFHPQRLSRTLSRPSLSPMLDIASYELEELRRIEVGDISTKYTGRERHETNFPSACLSLVYDIKGNNVCMDCGSAHPQWASVTYGSLICLECAGKHRSMGVKTSFVRSLTMDSWSHSQILSMLEGGNDQLHLFFERHTLTANTHAFSSLQSPKCRELSEVGAVMKESPRQCYTSSDSNHRSHQHSKNKFEKEVINVRSFDETQAKTRRKTALTNNNMDRTSGESITIMRYRTKAALFYREQLAVHVSKVKQSGRYKGRKLARNGGRRRKTGRGPSKRKNTVAEDPFVAREVKKGNAVEVLSRRNSQCFSVAGSTFNCRAGKTLVRCR